MTILILESAYQNSFKLGEFLREVRGEKNDFSGKYSVKLSKLRTLFDDSWENIPTRGGHTKLKHKITHVVVNFQNHKDPVDPGAVVTIADAVQNHINTLFEKILGFSTRQLHTKAPDFKAALKRWQE